MRIAPSHLSVNNDRYIDPDLKKLVASFPEVKFSEARQDADLVELGRRLVHKVVLVLILRCGRVKKGAKIELDVSKGTTEALLVSPVHVGVLVGHGQSEMGVGRRQGDVLRVAEWVERGISE